MQKMFLFLIVGVIAVEFVGNSVYTASKTGQASQTSDRDQELWKDVEERVSNLQYEACSQEAEIAENIMALRQAGEPLEPKIQEIRAATTISLEQKNELIDQIVAVYDEPEYATLDKKKKAVDDYRNEAYRTCVQNIRK